METKSEFKLTALEENLYHELGILPERRRLPLWREIYKIYDIDLLPHASAGTSLCEIFERRGGVLRTTSDNLIGIIAPAGRVQALINEVRTVPAADAHVPDFEFSKEEIIDFNLKLPFLFNISFSGKLENAKTLSVRVKGLKKSRIENVTPPGIEIQQLLRLFEINNPQEYRRRVKNDLIAEALFYAESVEIELEKNVNVEIGISFDVENVQVTVDADTSTHKKYTLRYTGGHKIPFGTSIKKGKHLFQ